MRPSPLRARRRKRHCGIPPLPRATHLCSWNRMAFCIHASQSSACGYFRSGGLGLVLLIVLRAFSAVARLNAARIVSVPLCFFANALRSEEHTSELQSRRDLVCRLLLEKKKER